MPYKDPERNRIEGKRRAVRWRKEHPEEYRRYQKQWANENRERLRARNRARFQSNQRFLTAVKATAGCIDCGFSDDPARLHFDHRNKAEKKFGLGVCGPRKLETVVAEVEKCVVRCYSCHATRHFRDDGMPKGMLGH